MGGGVATVAFDGQGGSGVEPTGIGTSRSLHHDFGTVKAEGADPLTGIFDGEPERSAVFGP